MTQELKEELKDTIKDNTFRLEEMKDSMISSIKNVIDVLAQQRKLIEIIEKSEDKDFEKFINDLKQDIKYQIESVNKLQKRKDAITLMLDIINRSEDAKNAVNLLCESVGMFPDEE